MSEHPDPDCDIEDDIEKLGDQKNAQTDNDSNAILTGEGKDPSSDSSKTMLPRSAPTATAGQPTSRCTPVAWCSVLVLVLSVTILLLAVSLKKLTSTEYGVQYNRNSKILDDAARSGGLHIGPPGFKFIKFPSTQITVDLPGDTCISMDGLRVQFSVTFQYQIQAESLSTVILKYRNFETWAGIVEAAGNSAVQHACSLFSISNFQTKRGEIQLKMQESLKLKLEGAPDGDKSDGVYAIALSLQLREVTLPEAYQAAVAEKQAATEDIILAQNQRVQETTKAQTVFLSSQEEAKRINSTATNEADILLTEATLRAKEIKLEFENEALTIAQSKKALNLTNDGVLAFLSNRLYQKVSTLTVSASEPASLSRKESL